MSTKPFDVDLFVIGAGSGGVRAGRMAATYGKRVMVAEEYRTGGTCVIRGCVPKKLLVYASRFSEEFEDARGFGWTVPDAQFDWQGLIAAKDKEIARLEAIYARNLASAGAELVKDRAVLKDPHTVHLLKSDRYVTAETILIATGARAFVLEEVEGCELSITSNEAFHLAALPPEIIIVGAGYIAIEFAGIFNGLGSKVMLVHHGEELLRGFDRELRVRMREEMANRGIEVRLTTSLARIEDEAGRRRVTFQDGTQALADVVMFAVGRRPNSLGLGLEHCGVELGERRAVKVDAYSQTTAPNIYAVGDVTNRVNLTPIAIREGAAFAETLYNQNPIAVDHTLIPTAVFGTPEIGTVGLSEEDARKSHARIDIYKTAFRPMKATLSGRRTEMFMKLIVDGETGRVLGCHILGEAAGEMAQIAAIALKMKATKADFDATVALHPSAAEELVLLRSKSS
ncbi:MAG: glutathione-disulfide reductase [Alphaproteobacteria bacterium]|nr:glutathione-disulfide reductase [Alphaproteobacteria bacterium]